MRIRGIALAPGSLVRTNDDILDEIRNRNGQCDLEAVETYCRRLSYLLRQAGAVTRTVRDRANGETALSLMLSAAHDALAHAELKPIDIDLVIYCGVGRGFIEPANAAFLCQSMGVSCDNFDVSEACMSWIRALHIAQNYLRNGVYSRILVINGEFNATQLRVRSVFTGIDSSALNYKFAAFTIGEAASAVVVTNSAKDWSFTFRYDPELAALCTIPLPEYAEFSRPDDRIGLMGVDQLTSLARELMAPSVAASVSLARETISDFNDYQVWIPHAASASACREAAKKLGLEHRLYWKVFPRYGNLVSASIPAGIVMALSDRAIEWGQSMVLCPASAGGSAAVVCGFL